MEDMGFNEYQEKAALTDLGTAAQDSLKPVGWLYYVLGLGGETGELLEKIKKLFRDNQGKVTPEFKESVKKELGDILWYHSRLSAHFDIKLSDVAETNITKLMSRMKRNQLHGDGDNR